MQYHVDGQLVERESATLSVGDSSFRRGDAAVEVLRVYGGDVFRWDEHARRLARTCDRLGVSFPGTADLLGRIDELLGANGLADALLRVTVTRGSQPVPGPEGPTGEPTVIVTAEPAPRGGREGTRTWASPATVQTVKARRPVEGWPADLKTNSYLPSVLAERETVPESDEALVRSPSGDVLGGATSNLCFVDDRGLHAPREAGVFPGITQSRVLDLAAETDVPVNRGRYSPEDVRSAEEAFLTSTRWEIRPVESLDGISVGGGPVTELLARMFDNRVEAACY